MARTVEASAGEWLLATRDPENMLLIATATVCRGGWRCRIDHSADAVSQLEEVRRLANARRVICLRSAGCVFAEGIPAQVCVGTQADISRAIEKAFGPTPEHNTTSEGVA